MMFEMMEEVFPTGVTWSKPHGGMFLWGVLPEGMDAAEVLQRAIEKKVAVPGAAFHRAAAERTPCASTSRILRRRIREGVLRLGTTLKELLGEKNRRGLGSSQPRLTYWFTYGTYSARAMPCRMAVSATARATSRWTFLSSGLGISSPAGVMREHIDGGDQHFVRDAARANPQRRGRYRGIPRHC